MKRSVFLFVFLFGVGLSIIHSNDIAIAKVDEIQLEAYLVNISWTEEELEEHLQFYDLSLKEMESLEELKSYLGTPVNNENLHELLTKYGMDYDDLEKLLAEYGETYDDYKFIEDLELDVQFYLNHQNQFSIATDFLSLFGLTEDEIENLFEHFSKVDEVVIGKALNDVNDSLSFLSYLKGDENLTVDESQQLLSIWNELLKALNVDTVFFLVKNGVQSEISFDDLVSMESFDDYSLEMSLANNQGDVLATLIYSPEMLDSHLVYESLEQITEVVGLAEEYRENLEIAKLPKTVGNYFLKIILSLFFIISGLVMLKSVRGRVSA